jgi:hypothetical protein
LQLGHDKEGLLLRHHRLSRLIGTASNVSCPMLVSGAGAAVGGGTGSQMGRMQQQLPPSDAAIEDTYMQDTPHADDESGEGLVLGRRQCWTRSIMVQ